VTSRESLALRSQALAEVYLQPLFPPPEVAAAFYAGVERFHDWWARQVASGSDPDDSRWAWIKSGGDACRAEALLADGLRYPAHLRANPNRPRP
jgi:hypothetical protein